jgi:hypothetical protein
LAGLFVEIAFRAVTLPVRLEHGPKRGVTVRKVVMTGNRYR